jgi:hypothetical protein
MLLPEKHIKISESIWGLGGILLRILEKPKTFDDLLYDYQKINDSKLFPSIHSINEVVLALDLLYAIGAITKNDKGELIYAIN